MHQRPLSLPRLSFVLCALALSACPDEWGNGDRITDERELEDFSAIDNSGELDVLVEQGERFEVVVSIDENVIDRVQTEVVGDTLRIRTRGQLAHLVRGPHVRVTMPTLSSARVSGSGNLELYDFLDSETLALRVSGSGDLYWQGESLEVDASVSGSGDLALDGATDYLDLQVSGSGDARALNCVAQDARVSVSGAGDASVYVEGEIDAEASGAGDLLVRGNPHFTRRKESGAGDIYERWKSVLWGVQSAVAAALATKPRPAERSVANALWTFVRGAAEAAPEKRGVTRKRGR